MCGLVTETDVVELKLNVEDFNLFFEGLAMEDSKIQNLSVRKLELQKS